MCVCVCACVCVCVHVHMHVCMSKYVCPSVCACMCVDYVASYCSNYQGVTRKMRYIHSQITGNINTGGMVRHLAKDDRINVQLLS